MDTNGIDDSFSFSLDGANNKSARFLSTNRSHGGYIHYFIIEVYKRKNINATTNIESRQQ